MKSAGWPEDEEPIEFEKLTKPLVNAVWFAYDLTRKNEDADIPWEGPDIGWRERATCFGPKEQLTSKNLTYSKEEQGRSALEEIVGLAIRLGIEQGRRIATSEDGGGLRWKAKMFDLFVEKKNNPDSV